MESAPTTTPIRSVLVANRGEIVVRVLRTCRRLGLRGVAIFTDGDAAAPHVRLADQARHVPDYLDIDAVVGAALAAGVDAIHPGYGFLSERAAFARAVEAAGLILVGPSASVMEAMGRKDAAREIAVRAGVPVVPAYDLDVDPATMIFPILVKAAAGGGGKGMRIVRRAADLEDALAAAGREAAAAFGDDTLLIETFVEHGRHIEVQVLGDTQGTVLHLHERDCSVQRRHQKVIEEAPAPTLDAATRTKITDAGVALAKAVGYTGAGTVEFLLDADGGAFYFLEMNTRLQVEHPVTEAICGGLDLVELQLRVAAGEPLPLRQHDLVVHGHAIEARVYAEDAYGGYLPQAGTARLVRWPSGPGVRVDHALVDGQEVSTAYDPLLGKIIVHADDRETARRRLVEALDQTAILGLTTNTGFLREVAAGPPFAAAEIDVAWLDRVTLEPPDPAAARATAAWLAAQRVRAAHPDGPFAADGWRLSGPAEPMTIELDRILAVDVIGGRVIEGAEEWSIDPRILEVPALVDDHGVELLRHGQRFVFAVPDVFGEHDEAVADGVVTAPMPSVVVEVRVGVGDTVEADEILGVVEAMKMELALRAPFAGTIAAVEAGPGDRVRQGAHLFSVHRSP